MRAPARWVRDYFRSLGQPWANPRLNEAQQYRIRYWLDPEFRAREYVRLQFAKEQRAARIAATCDGTLTPRVVQRLFAEATHCPYCRQRMRSRVKSIDHVVPLAKGGAHSITNVVVCCLACNVRKGSRLPLGIFPN